MSNLLSCQTIFQSSFTILHSPQQVYLFLWSHQPPLNYSPSKSPLLFQGTPRLGFPHTLFQIKSVPLGVALELSYALPFWASAPELGSKDGGLILSEWPLCFRIRHWAGVVAFILLGFYLSTWNFHSTCELWQGRSRPQCSQPAAQPHLG